MAGCASTLGREKSACGDLVQRDLSREPDGGEYDCLCLQDVVHDRSMKSMKMATGEPTGTLGIH